MRRLKLKYLLLTGIVFILLGISSQFVSCSIYNTSEELTFTTTDFTPPSSDIDAIDDFVRQNTRLIRQKLNILTQVKTTYLNVEYFCLEQSCEITRMSSTTVALPPIGCFARETGLEMLISTSLNIEEGVLRSFAGLAEQSLDMDNRLLQRAISVENAKEITHEYLVNNGIFLSQYQIIIFSTDSQWRSDIYYDENAEAPDLRLYIDAQTGDVSLMPQELEEPISDTTSTVIEQETDTSVILGIMGLFISLAVYFKGYEWRNLFIGAIGFIVGSFLAVIFLQDILDMPVLILGVLGGLVGGGLFVFLLNLAIGFLLLFIGYILASQLLEFFGINSIIFSTGITIVFSFIIHRVSGLALRLIIAFLGSTGIISSWAYIQGSFDPSFEFLSEEIGYSVGLLFLIMIHVIVGVNRLRRANAETLSNTNLQNHNY